jgi:hypothetical protein
MRHISSEVIDTGFRFNDENFEDYYQNSMKMSEDVRWVKNIVDIKYKLKNPETIDTSLYTTDYLEMRLKKIEQQKTANEVLERIIALTDELAEVNRGIDVMRPIVFDPVEGTKPENHEKMSLLDDKRKELEDAIADTYATMYMDLYKNLPKIFGLIMECVDVDTLRSCFKQMRMVMSGQNTHDKGFNQLLNESMEKYKLPSGFWDPILSKNKHKNKK